MALQQNLWKLSHGANSMRNNITAFQHPTIKRKIRRAIWLAKLEVTKERKKNSRKLHHAVQYVQNRKGNNILRIDYNSAGFLTVWGDLCRNITPMVVEAMGLVYE